MLLTGITFTPINAASTETITLEGKYLYKETKVVLDLMNELRVKKGLNKLKMDEKLCQFAETRAAESYVYYSHTRPNGQPYNTIGTNCYGENICISTDEGEGVYERWYNSQPHYENMINPQWKSVGIAAFQSGEDKRVVWVQLFSINTQKVKDSYPKDKTKTVKVTSLKINKYEINLSENLYAGEIVQASVVGYNDLCDFQLKSEGIEWESTNEKVARFDSKNRLYTLKSGTTTITAKGYGKTISLKLNVNKNYKIKYVVNGGTLNQFSPLEYGWETVLKNPVKKGCLFSGWYTTPSFDSKTKVKEINWWDHGDVTVYAKWSKIKLKEPESLKLTITKSNKLSLDFKDVSKADGYQVYYSTNKNFRTSLTTKAITESSKYTSKVKVKKGKTYYCKVRAYRYDSTGKRVYGEWSKIKKLKVS